MRSTADENGQVLKVSGVGPREELEKVGIKVVFELPGVGENLKDHLGIGMFFTYAFFLPSQARAEISRSAKKGTSLQFITNPLGGLGALVEWLRYRTGPMTTNASYSHSAQWLLPDGFRHRRSAKRSPSFARPTTLSPNRPESPSPTSKTPPLAESAYADPLSPLAHR